MRIKSPYGNNDFSDYKKVKESKETKEQKHSINIKGFFSEVFDWIKILFYIIGWTIFIMLIICMVITIGVIFVHLFSNLWEFIFNGGIEKLFLDGSVENFFVTLLYLLYYLIPILEVITVIVIVYKGLKE